MEFNSSSFSGKGCSFWKAGPGCIVGGRTWFTRLRVVNSGRGAGSRPRAARRDGEVIQPELFSHTMAAPNMAAIEKWKRFLRPHYEHWGIDIDAVPSTRLRMPFGADACAFVEEIAPRVVSFHFGLPDPTLVERLKNRRITILSSATSVREAKWLESRGCDAVIVQGVEAGGHRAMFLETDTATQTGLFALLPQVADQVGVPVVAAGGIADGRGIVAAFALGASAVQLGTAYLFCPEASVAPLYRKALEEVGDNGTALTNLFSGRPARGILNRYMLECGLISDAALPFPPRCNARRPVTRRL